MMLITRNIVLVLTTFLAITFCCSVEYASAMGLVSSKVSSKLDYHQFDQVQKFERTLYDLRSLAQEAKERMEKEAKLLNEVRESLKKMRTEAEVLEEEAKRDVQELAKPKIDCLILALSWRPAYEYTGAKQPLPKHPALFTIHGLWPHSTVKLRHQFCKTDEKFQLKKLDHLRDVLNINWPSLLPNTRSKSFWRRQWRKHGSCTVNLSNFGDINKYFTVALNLFSRLNINSSDKLAKLIGSGPLRVVKSRLFEVLAPESLGHPAKSMQLICKKIKDSTEKHLFEVRFCYDLQLNYISCPPREESCKGDSVLMVPEIL